MTDDPVMELHKARLEAQEINAKIRLSQDRFNGRVRGRPLTYHEYAAYMRRKDAVVRRIIELEARCSLQNRQRKVEHNTKGKVTLAKVFMEVAGETLADRDYQRLLAAAVARLEERAAK